MDELDLLKELGRDIDPVDPAARARARILLQDRMRSTGPSIAPSRIPRRRSRSAMLVAALVASLVLLVVTIQVVLPPGSGGPNAAQATLDDLAHVAGSTGSSITVPGSYLYVRSSGYTLKTHTDIASGDSWSFIVPVDREKWLAPDGSGRILELYGAPRFVSEADRAAWRAAGSPGLLPSKNRDVSTYDAGELAPRDLGSLPNEPSSLAALISSGGVVTGSSGVMNDPLGVIATLLGEVPSSPELRSSLFLAAAELPGIASPGRLSDPSGRAGIGIAVVESGVRTELIFDVRTSALLSTSVARVAADGSPTQVIWQLTYEVRSIVASTHARPR